MEALDCVVIGAGVVGLAIGRACALAGCETVVLESEAAIGTGTSSRNSEVIHAGIYYPPGSLKARLCVRGRKALYAYCDQHGVPYWQCGKLIAAVEARQVPVLHHLAENAAASGVTNLQWLEAADLAALEPDLRATAALKSPSTGVVDSHAFMQALLGDFEAAGGMLALRSPALSGRVDAGGVVVRVGGDEPMEILARRLVIAAGLRSTVLAARIEGVEAQTIPGLRLAKGTYYALSGRSPFSHLIYPVPVEGGLGVHLTLDLSRQARFGPDVQWVDTVDYAVDPERAGSFYRSIRRYWPGLPDGALRPDYAGVRPKLVHAGPGDSDFVIQDARVHGVAGLVSLYGIESPGLTASLAIADEVALRLGLA